MVLASVEGVLFGEFAWALCGERRWESQVDTDGGDSEVTTLCGFVR